MKVINLVTIDYGGAYRAAVRISECINQSGMESSVILRTKKLAEGSAEEVFRHGYERFLSKVKNLGNLLLSKNDIIVEKFGTDISKYDQVKTADVIILHWVNSFLSPRNVNKLVRLGKPIIWVMHDMWLFTGGCHLDRYCGRYRQLCGNCPQLGSLADKDRTRKALKEKMDLLTGQGICFVGPSSWIVNCARESTMLKEERVTRIPNPVPLHCFSPEDKQKARKTLGVPCDKKIITFGALKSTDDPNKGFSYLKRALRHLDSGQYVTMVFGNSDRDPELEQYMPVCYMGIVNQEEKLRLIYTASDVFVAPSLQDNYPSTVLEAMACKTPVAAFSIGGMTDLIVDTKNGRLVPIRDADKLAEAIEYCVRNTETLGEYAYQHVQSNNSYETVGAQYRCLCEELLKEKRYGR